jgi:hypothetical protein
MVPDNSDLILMREILHYLELHPNAADTLEGILMWWCKRQSNELDAGMLKTILDELVNTKMLVKIVSQSGEAIYKRAP